MNKQTALIIKILPALVLIIMSFTSVMNAQRASAAPIPAGCPGSTQQGPPAPGVCESIPPGCPGTTQQGPPAPGVDCPYEAASGPASSSNDNSSIKTDCEPEDGAELNSENCALIGYLVAGINVLSALAGMAIVASIMFAGYQYMTARDNPGQISQARMRIVWALVALLLFIFMYALLNFLVPGGVL